MSREELDAKAEAVQRTLSLGVPQPCTAPPRCSRMTDPQLQRRATTTFTSMGREEVCPQLVPPRSSTPMSGALFVRSCFWRRQK